MKREKSTLAVNIAKLRKARGLTQPELAHSVGVHVNTIKDIERGLSQGHQSTREAIAEALGCEPWELEVPGFTEGTNVNKRSGKSNNAQLILHIQSRLTSLNEEQLGFVDGFIDDLLAHTASSSGLKKSTGND